MPFPDPLGIGYIVYGSDEKAPFVLVLHYFQQSIFAVDQTTTQAMANAMDSAFSAPMKTWMAADCDYLGCSVQVNDGGIVYTASSNASAGAGTAAGQSLPDYAAAVIRKRTSVGGKQGRGRWFLGCVPELFQDTGQLTITGQAAADSLGLSMRTSLTVGTNVWISGHMSRVAVTVVPIAAATTQNRLVTQRRRRLRPALV